MPAATMEIEAMKTKLKKSWQEADRQKVAMAKASKQLADERVAQVVEVMEDLRGVYTRQPSEGPKEEGCRAIELGARRG